MTTIDSVETISAVVEAVGHPGASCELRPREPPGHASRGVRERRGDPDHRRSTRACARTECPHQGHPPRTRAGPPPRRGATRRRLRRLGGLLRGLPTIGDRSALIVEHLEGDEVEATLARVTRMASAHGWSSRDRILSRVGEYHRHRGRERIGNATVRRLSRGRCPSRGVRRRCPSTSRKARTSVPGASTWRTSPACQPRTDAAAGWLGGQIDVLVHVAGIMRAQHVPVDEVPAGGLGRRSSAVNLRGTFLMVKHVVPRFHAGHRRPRPGQLRRRRLLRQRLVPVRREQGRHAWAWR